MKEATMTEAKANEPTFTVLNLYTKDISYEAPNSPRIFNDEWHPDLNFDLEIANEKLADNVYEAGIHLTLTVKLKADENAQAEKTAFLVEVKQAGIFAVEGYNDAEIEQLLAINAPELLFPYLREVVSGLVTKGGFPQLVLPPMNFAAMYQQHQTKTSSNVKEEVVAAND